MKTLTVTGKEKEFTNSATNEKLKYWSFETVVNGITVKLKAVDSTSKQLLVQYFSSKEI